MQKKYKEFISLGISIFFSYIITFKFVYTYFDFNFIISLLNDFLKYINDNYIIKVLNFYTLMVIIPVMLGFVLWYIIFNPLFYNNYKYQFKRNVLKLVIVLFVFSINFLLGYYLFYIFIDIFSKTSYSNFLLSISFMNSLFYIITSTVICTKFLINKYLY